MKRTYYCGNLRRQQIGEEVTLVGWVSRRRDHGGVIFVDLRDRTGIVQVVFDPVIDVAAHQSADRLRNEFVIGVKGRVRARGEGAENPNLATGEIEIATDYLEILNVAETPAFPIEDEVDVAEEVRLKYRYLDLRRPKMQKTLKMRHKAMLACRNYMDEQGFLEIETPILMNSTPEGARDVLVPSRLNPGDFYALPQSPQQFKQILMMSGVDRYFQIPKCFRDEDTRADRQLEFTQIDLEMSFATEDDVLEVTEGLIKRIFEEAGGIPVETPFKRMPYAEAMDRFGSDKPDTRFEMELADVSDLVADSDFKVFTSVLENGGQIKGLAAPGGADFPRREIDALTDFVATYKAKGLAWIKVTTDGFDSSIVKFFSSGQLQAVAERMGAKAGDLMLFVADQPKIVADALSNLRLHLGRRLELIDKDRFDMLWVVDFPLFEWDSEENRYQPAHHLFTSPSSETAGLIETDPRKVRAQHYDLVINGNEVASGSVRIHQWAIQQKVLEVLKLSPEDIKTRFGYFIEALQYGTPPHAGIAPGLDRLIMLMLGEDNIREVIAFPKTQRGACLMTGAPSVVSGAQLEELSIRVDEI
ncbi:MAG: aspartate--tRNA ligase [Candidatus Poribacteria bacterium]|nr:aspartate--tRNA ligase [Candidatus Poribacteria bacterium]MDP6748992.1 aspartate--tRNA ligase [Candidatus Poribacteria bacterium]MDP6997670.1 aspartate--tRNA ligase [Candidatus Poribacteria bacterium]